MNHSKKQLKDIWHQVPPNYYQKGVKNNLLQKLWHTGKLNQVASLTSSINKKPKKILDVGCASGWFLSQIALKFPHAECTGVDVYEEAINYGKKIYPNLHLIQSDAHRLPFQDKLFDVVICCEVLEHVTNPEIVLKEIGRVLTPNGIAIIEMDTGNLLFNLVWHFWTHRRKGVWKDSHLHVFTTKKLENLILGNGFQIEEKKVFNFSMAVAFSLRAIS